MLQRQQCMEAAKTLLIWGQGYTVPNVQQPMFAEPC